MPAMGDPNFAQTVALICDHSPRARSDLILNKPLPMRMGEIFEQLEIELAGGPLRERQVLRGGPMQTDRGFVVHRAGGDWDSTLKVSDASTSPPRATSSPRWPAARARGGRRRLGLCRLGRRPAGGRDPRERLAQRAGRPGLIFDLPFESRWQAAGRLLGVESRASARSAAMPDRARPPASPELPTRRRRPRLGGRRRSACSGLRFRTTAHRRRLRRHREPHGLAARRVPATPERPRWEAIDALLREWQPALAVVGLPYNVDGSESAMTAPRASSPPNLGARASSRQLVDERYSSLEAEARLKAARESGLRRAASRKADVDAAAACVILERWFSEDT
jgi:putative transcriptional regulator